ncbi:MAG: hypothetical protein Q7R80_04530 [bacterium]|nr:hypothetical protein [bacterium]
MSITLKKCAEDGCSREFPAHYFHDYCPAHSTSETDRMAQDRASALYQRHGDTGLTLNALSGFLPADEGAALRAELCGERP